MFEAHARVDDLGADAVVRRDQADARQHAVRTPGEPLERRDRFLNVFRLSENTPADRNHRIRCQHVGASDVRIVGDLVPCRLGLGACQTRMASERGISASRAVSSMLDGRSASGSIPACASSVNRRGLALASTSLWAPGGPPSRARSRASSRRSVSRRGLSVRLKEDRKPALSELIGIRCRCFERAECACGAVAGQTSHSGNWRRDYDGTRAGSAASARQCGNDKTP